MRLAVIDHIVSLTPAHLPVAALCALCAAAGAASLVDGAHAVGAVPLDIPSLGCHYYTSNLHKWMCTPKGAAFLWAAPAAQQAQRGLLPLVTSHGYGLVSWGAGWLVWRVLCWRLGWRCLAGPQGVGIRAPTARRSHLTSRWHSRQQWFFARMPCHAVLPAGLPMRVPVGRHP